jgi:hypothetical protein
MKQEPHGFSRGSCQKIEVPSGTFVEFKKIGYKRTAKSGEKGGSVLSKSEAESMGFVIPSSR